MRAAIVDRYGPPSSIEVRDVATPTPGDGEVLVEVRAAAVNPLDWFLLTGQPYIARPAFGLFRPKRRTPGADVAGTVAAVGPGVTAFALGDEVWGACAGSFAEFVVTKAEHLVPKPQRVSFAEAGAVNIAAITALQALRDVAKVGAGQRVLINGASGGVGTYAVQIAVSMGAVVTGVCSGRNLDLVTSLGAQRVIDYTTTDFLDPVTLADGEQYDVVIDNVGNRSMRALRAVVARKGVVVVVGGPKDSKLLGPVKALAAGKLVGLFSSQRFASFNAHENQADLGALNELLESGAMRAVVDTIYPLAEAAAAIEHLATGRARGKIVVTP